MWQNGTDIGLLADYKKRHRVVEVESRVRRGGGTLEEPAEDLEPEKQVDSLAVSAQDFGAKKTGEEQS
jgi:hypothetical protein